MNNLTRIAELIENLENSWYVSLSYKKVVNSNYRTYLTSKQSRVARAVRLYCFWLTRSRREEIYDLGMDAGYCQASKDYFG